MALVILLVLALLVLSSGYPQDGNTTEVMDRLVSCSSKHKAGGGCCPRIGTYCDCAGIFKDGKCCPGCCTFECYQGKFRCVEQCGAEVDPPCTSWGWQGNGFCPVEGTTCRCQGHFVDTTCCGKVGFCRFKCLNGVWMREEKCPPPPCYQVASGCQRIGSRCTCQGSTKVNNRCCLIAQPRNTLGPITAFDSACNSFTCYNNVWRCNTKCLKLSANPAIGATA